MVAVLSVIGWFALFVGVSAVAPRIGYLAWPCWLALVAAGTNAVAHAVTRSRSVLLSGAFVAAALVALLGLDAWVLDAVVHLPHYAFYIPLGQS